MGRFLGFGSLPVILVVYALIFDRHSGAGTRAGNPLIEYLTFADLLILAFTTVWSYRYTRLARQLADPERRLAASSVDWGCRWRRRHRVLDVDHVI